MGSDAGRTVLHVFEGGGWSRTIRQNADGTTLLEIQWPNLSDERYRERIAELERLQVDDRPWEFRSPSDVYEQCRCEGKPLVTHKAHGHAISVRLRGRKKAAEPKGE